MSTLIDSAATNLKRLTALRAISLAGLVGAGWLLEQAFSTPALAFLLLGVCATAVSGRRTRQLKPLRQGEFFAHILMDWLWLPPLLAVSGGAANPFITYFLVPLTIAAATLPRLYNWLMAALCIATYTWLMLVFPGAATSPQDPHSAHEFQRHLLGMWATFVFSALLIAGFVNGMAATLRQRDQHLHRLRQEQARRDQILSLATLAAGTAHELATPLQTMGLLVEELQEQPALRESADLLLLRQQINACNQALAQLKARARDPDKRSAEPVAQFLNRCLERWQLLRPEVRFTLQQQGHAETCAILPLTLEQALTNLLNNAADANARAADACARTLSVRAEWDTQSLRVTICDSGPGVSEIQDSSQRGFGIGLLLSEAALAQLGGSLSLQARDDGSAGTQASFCVPLTQPDISETPTLEAAL